MDKTKKYLPDIFYPFDDDGCLQVTAGTSLLERSKLVMWSYEQACFLPVNREVFETAWKNEIDPTFGRFICWIIFSTGAELLAKGLCLIHDIEIRRAIFVRDYPSNEDDIDIWAKTQAKAILSNSQVPGHKYPVTNYRTLGYLISGKKPNKVNTSIKLEAPFIKLFRKVNASETEENLIIAAYDLLRETIRNRDAHAYVPNVRDVHVDLVSRLFTECFNILVKWLPGGANTLNEWKKNAANFNKNAF